MIQLLHFETILNFQFDLVQMENCLRVFLRKINQSGPELFSQLRELFLFPDKMFKYNIALIHCSKVVGKALGLAERPSFL